MRRLVPGELPADGIGNGGDELAGQAELLAVLPRKVLGRVFADLFKLLIIYCNSEPSSPFRHVPLDLILQQDVAHDDV